MARSWTWENQLQRAGYIFWRDPGFIIGDGALFSPMKPARRHLKPKELDFLGMKITQIFPCCVAHRVCSAQPANAGYLDIFYTWAVRLFLQTPQSSIHRNRCIQASLIRSMLEISLVLPIGCDRTQWLCWHIVPNAFAFSGNRLWLPDTAIAITFKGTVQQLPYAYRFAQS